MSTKCTNKELTLWVDLSENPPVYWAGEKHYLAVPPESAMEVGTLPKGAQIDDVNGVQLGTSDSYIPPGLGWPAKGGLTFWKGENVRVFVADRDFSPP